jgi:hypothetical protein
MAPLLSLLGLIELSMLASEYSPTIGLPVSQPIGPAPMICRRAKACASAVLIVAPAARGPALHRGQVTGMAVPSVANPWRTVSEAGGRLAAKRATESKRRPLLT